MYNCKQWRNSRACFPWFFSPSAAVRTLPRSSPTCPRSSCTVPWPFRPPRPPRPVCTSTRARTSTRCWTISARRTSPGSARSTRSSATHLGESQTGQLTREDRADLAIMQDQIALNLLDLNEIHSHLHSPQLYVETLGNALFAPYVLEYAPKPERIRHIMARLQKVPLYLDQASTNLVAAAGRLDPGGDRRKPGQHQPGGQGNPRRRVRRIKPKITPGPPAPRWTR